MQSSGRIPSISPLAQRIAALDAINDQSQSSLLRLPAEIQQKIFALALTFTANRGVWPYGASSIARDIALPLLLTCRAVYLVTHNLPFYVNPIVNFEDGHYVPPKLNINNFRVNADAWQWHNIRRLELTEDQSGLEGGDLLSYAISLPVLLPENENTNKPRNSRLRIRIISQISNRANVQIDGLLSSTTVRELMQSARDALGIGAATQDRLVYRGRCLTDSSERLETIFNPIGQLEPHVVMYQSGTPTGKTVHKSKSHALPGESAFLSTLWKPSWPTGVRPCTRLDLLMPIPVQIRRGLRVPASYITNLVVRLHKDKWGKYSPYSLLSHESNTAFCLDPAWGKREYYYDSPSPEDMLRLKSIRLREQACLAERKRLRQEGDSKALQDLVEQPDTRTRIRSEEAKMEKGWGGHLKYFPSLRQFRLILEVPKARVAELDQVAECAEEWVFPLGMDYEANKEMDLRHASYEKEEIQERIPPKGSVHSNLVTRARRPRLAQLGNANDAEVKIEMIVRGEIVYRRYPKQPE